jgi:hypothetical protein
MQGLEIEDAAPGLHVSEEEGRVLTRDVQRRFDIAEQAGQEVLVVMDVAVSTAEPEGAGAVGVCTAGVQSQIATVASKDDAPDEVAGFVKGPPPATKATVMADPRGVSRNEMTMQNADAAEPQIDLAGEGVGVYMRGIGNSKPPTMPSFDLVPASLRREHRHVVLRVEQEVDGEPSLPV